MNGRNHPDDVETLRLISNVAAAAFAPFISAAGARLFGFEQLDRAVASRAIWRRSSIPSEYTKWRSFRDSEDSRFVSLVMPRVLARLPYGAAHQADRRVRLRGSADRRRPAPRKPMAARAITAG